MIPTKIVYVASPYSHEDPRVEEKRYELVSEAVAGLMKLHPKFYFFSPILHSHVLAREWNIEPDVGWEIYDLKMLSVSDLLLVFKDEGWEESKGVAAEIEYATKNGIEISYLDA